MTIKANAPLDLPDGFIYNRPEAERTKESYREYTLTECERLAYIEKYGAPKMPYKPSKNSYDARLRKGGKGA